MAGNCINNATRALIAVCIALCLLLVSIVFWDRSVALYIHSQASLPQGLFALLEIPGEPLPYVLVGGLVLSFCGIVYLNTGFSFSEILLPNRAAYIIAATAISWVFAEILQIAFGRSCPFLYVEKEIYVFRPFAYEMNFASFPSEHGAVSAAASTGFSSFIPRYRPTFSLIAAVVAISRLLSGANYLSDVAAGVLLGAAVATVLETIFVRLSGPLRAR